MLRKEEVNSKILFIGSSFMQGEWKLGELVVSHQNKWQVASWPLSHTMCHIFCDLEHIIHQTKRSEARKGTQFRSGTARRDQENWRLRSLPLGFIAGPGWTTARAEDWLPVWIPVVTWQMSIGWGGREREAASTAFALRQRQRKRGFDGGRRGGVRRGQMALQPNPRRKDHHPAPDRICWSRHETER